MTTESRHKRDKIHLHWVPRGVLKLAIARLLRDRELSGTDIMDLLEEKSHGAWRPSPGSIYPLLAHLEGAGWIETVWQEGRTKVYRLTDIGRKAIDGLGGHQQVFRQKARMAPRIWGLVLDPAEQARLYDDALVTVLDCIRVVLPRLKARERRRLANRLRRAVDEINGLIEEIEQR